ncbi:YdeI/OmpD-associated family protein, partial [bacterium]|nr:YdeI/OmpD-associated family protein [bacterium]
MEDDLDEASDVEFDCIVERKHPAMPRFVVLPANLLVQWKLSRTTVVEGSMNGIDTGRRSLKRWDADRWFIDLPQELCRRAGIDTGSRVGLVLRVASERLPEELTQLLSQDDEAKAKWDCLSLSRQRMLREYVASAKEVETR